LTHETSIAPGGRVVSGRLQEVDVAVIWHGLLIGTVA
jgi:hypothetical protein